MRRMEIMVSFFFQLYGNNLSTAWKNGDFIS